MRHSPAALISVIRIGLCSLAVAVPFGLMPVDAALAGLRCSYTQGVTPGSGCFDCQAECTNDFGSNANCTCRADNVCPDQAPNPICQAAPSAPQIQVEALPDVKPPVLSVPIPNLSFGSIMVTTADGQRSIDVPWMAQYIAAFYRYGVGVAGLLASVMFLIGGFQYLTAGESDRIAKAKKRITDAIIGMILCLGSYALLNLINPDLVTLSALRNVRTVKSEPFPSNETDPDDIVLNPSEIPPPATDGTPIEPLGTPAPVKHVGQCDPAYASIPYNDKAGQCSTFTICTSGCGIASAAMVLGSLTGKTPDPGFVSELAALAQATGNRTCNNIKDAPACPQNSCNGTGHNFFVSPTVLDRYGLAGETISGKERILEKLREGKPIIASVGRSIFTKHGHFIVLAGVNTNGTIRVVDPGKCETCGYVCDWTQSSHDSKPCDSKQSIPTIPQKAVPADYVFGAMSGAWYIHPK